MQLTDVEDHRDSQLQCIDKGSPSLLWRSGRSLWFDGGDEAVCGDGTAVFFYAFSSIFRTPPSGVESRLVATFLSPPWPTVVGRRGLPAVLRFSLRRHG